MPERNHRSICYLLMARNSGKVGYDVLETFLTPFRDVPVLRTGLNESHRHTQAVHLSREEWTPEEHLLRHVLMAIKQRLDTVSLPGQSQAYAVSRFSDDIIKHRLPLKTAFISPDDRRT